MFAVAILKLVPRTRIELVMTGYQPIVIPFNYPGKFGGSKENRTPINGVTSHRTDHYTMKPNLVDLDGIEPLAATPLINGYRVTAGNGGQDP